VLQERWEGKRVVELEGPQRVPQCLAAAFAKALGTPVRAEVVPHVRWESIFRGQGMKNPIPRIQMIEDLMRAGSTLRTAEHTLARVPPSVDQAITTLIQRQGA